MPTSGFHYSQQWSPLGGIRKEACTLTTKKLTPNLDMALVPRDAANRKQPMVFAGGTDGEGRPLYFPILPPENDGSRAAMDFEEDFQPGGKYYGKVNYHPGFYAQPLGIMENGYTMPLFPGNVIFEDPRLNLFHLASAVHQNGLPLEWVPAASQVVAALESLGVLPTSSASVPVSDESEATFLPDRKGQLVKICNSKIRVNCLRRILSDNAESFEISMTLLRTGDTVIVPEAELENLAGFISARFPKFHLAAETPNAAALLAEYIRDQLENVAEIAVVQRPGWIEHKGIHVYAHDGATATNNLQFECRHAIPVDSTLSQAGAFQATLDILNIGCHQVTLPLLLTTIAGVLAAVFQDAGYPPRFCTFLYGLSGSLKTATAEVFAGFYGIRDHNTFRDTPAAVDVNIKEHRDRLLLVDDFQPPVVAAEGQAMKKTLEHIVRLFGDDVGKKRSNSTATATRSERPRGTCLITGESVSGSYSSLLRCLLVPISRGDIDGTLLRRYQEASALWTSNYVYFLPWVGTHWPQLVEKIRRSFPDLRTHFSQATAEPRLTDTGAVLELTGEILLDYGISCGGISPEDRQQFCLEWQEIIANLLTFSSSFSQDVDIATLCRDALNNAQETGALQLAATADDYRPGMDGFYSPSRLWLRQDPLLRVLRRQSADMQASCSLTAKAVLPELYAKGLIVRDEEDGKNSYLKKTPYLPALGKRTRMLCFNHSEITVQM